MMHYATLGNGIAPNTVPDKAQVWYMMRAPKRAVLDVAFDRLKEVARGAAIMTGTTLESVEMIGCANEIISNQIIADVFFKNMNESGGPKFSEEDYELGRKITALFAPGALELGAKAFQIPDEDTYNILQNKALYEAGDRKIPMPASADLDVSWLKPLGGFNCATWPIGVFTHTWQAAACAGLSVGMHGMLFAAKTLAGTVYDLMSDKETLKKVKDEFAESTKDLHYKFSIGPDSIPHRVQ